MDKPWDENIIEITESYEEKYPTGKRNYEMISFGPLYEKRYLYIPKDIISLGSEAVDKYIIEARAKMHDRLVRAVGDAVVKAIKDGRLVGVTRK